MSTLDRLSPEQREVVETWGRGMAVMAGAGSGKTTTLVVKCEELLRRQPDARFAAVSFTDRSAADLREKLSRRLSLQGEGGALSGHWVMTIHGLCAAILHEYPREAGFTGEERMLSESESAMLWTRACDGLWFDDLPEEVAQALERMLARESRDEVRRLLTRGRNLEAFGVLDRLAAGSDLDAQALARLVRHVVERYDRAKRRRGSIDFGDLEAGAERALAEPAVAQSFRKRFALVMVDEFQDTNPVQARILLRFCREDLANLCVVGDPKQSIYRFRDADVSVFEDFCRRMPVRLSLTRNFRSRPGILEFTNRVCAPAFEASQLTYEALVPQRPAEEAPAVTRLSVRGPDDFARHILAETRAGVPLDSMALLVRRIRGNERWFKALTAAGIPLALGSGGLFWDDPRVRELVALLRWWDNPANSLSGAVFLRAPWVGLPDARIEAWLREDSTFVRPFFASDLPLARVLAPQRGLPVRPGELLLQALTVDGVEAEIGAPALGLWHRCEELSQRGLDFHGVVLEISRAIEESRRERDVPPPKNQGQLPVLTLHAAKGLEFDRVFLIDLGSRSRAAVAPLLFWDREKGAFLGGRDADGERTKEDPEESAWRSLEAAKNLAESKRVFYVALTRARESLTLVWPEEEPKTARAGAAPPPPEAVYSKESWRGWIEASGELPPWTSGTHASGTGARELEPEPENLEFAWSPQPSAPARIVRPRHGVTEWNLLAQCGRAYEWTFIRPRLGFSEESAAETPQDAGRTGERHWDPRALGSAVHRGLETGDFESLRRLEAEAAGDFRAEPLIRWASESAFMADASAAAWNELAFEAVVGGEVLVGSIDRLVRSADGSYTILDYKVARRRRAGAELLETYATQVALYAEGLRSLLGPEGARARIRCVLVAVDPEGVTEIEAPVPPSGGGISARLARMSAEIVAGLAGLPQPSSRCRHCTFRRSCSEGLSISGGVAAASSGGGAASGGAMPSGAGGSSP